MTRTPQFDPENESSALPEDASPIAVISAYGAFRVLVVLLAIWTFFAGFALVTGFEYLSFGDGRTAERVAGFQMIIGLVPVYGLLAWDRKRYRLLIWVPYGAQLAIIVPGLWAMFTGDLNAGTFLLMVVSLIFFVLMFYFWWHSHPLDFFRDDAGEEEWEDEEDEDGEMMEEGDDEPEPSPRGESGARRPFTRGRPPASPQQRRSGRFRRRDG
jgi:hypothetical protein